MKTEGSVQPIQPASSDAPSQRVRESKPAATNARGRGRAFTIFFLVLLAALLAGGYFWIQSQKFETTDDAQVDTHLSVISARVDGSITRVYVDENQMVKAGEPLVDLDPRDYQVSLDQTRAQLAPIGLASRITRALPLTLPVAIFPMNEATSMCVGHARMHGAS